MSVEPGPGREVPESLGWAGAVRAVGVALPPLGVSPWSSVPLRRDGQVIMRLSTRINAAMLRTASYLLRNDDDHGSGGPGAEPPGPIDVRLAAHRKASSRVDAS
jgi:hypothetical protein